MMCVFCNNDIIIEETKKFYIEQCNKCNSKIYRLKESDFIFVRKFPKQDKIRWLSLFVIPFSILLFCLPIIIIFMNGERTLENIDLKFYQLIFLIGTTIMLMFLLYINLKNIYNYKKAGYLYYLFFIVELKNNKKNPLYLNYSFIFLFIIVIVFEIFLIFKYYI